MCLYVLCLPAFKVRSEFVVFTTPCLADKTAVKSNTLWITAQSLFWSNLRKDSSFRMEFPKGLSLISHQLDLLDGQKYSRL